MRGKHVKEARRKEALKRNEVWNTLSFEQQLVELDKRPGSSAKQRAKIQKKMEKRNK